NLALYHSGITQSSASSPLIGHRNCSSGEAHRQANHREEVELGEEEPSGSARRSKKIEGAAGASEERGQRRKTLTGKCKFCMLQPDGRGRERAQAGAGVSKVSIIGVSG
ncbi:unnamed protein product, partial [Staurois parvus]